MDIGKEQFGNANQPNLNVFELLEETEEPEGNPPSTGRPCTLYARRPQDGNRTWTPDVQGHYATMPPDVNILMLIVCVIAEMVKFSILFSIFGNDVPCQGSRL